MIRIKLRLVSSALALACTALAHAAPVIIDSEQKAKAALATTTSIQQQAAVDARGGADYARGKVEDALRQLSAATTPAVLSRSRDGIHLPCSVSGELIASLTRGFPRNLKLNWNACRYVDIDGRSRGREGPIEVLLLSDTFAPERVASIRVGSANADFIDTRHIDEDGQITDETTSVNLRVSGLIPMIRAFPLYGFFIGPFAYEQTGFLRTVTQFEYPIGAPIQVSDSVVSYEHLFATGSLTYNDAKTFLTENLQLHWGTVTRDAAYTGWPDSTGGYTVDGLRLRGETDFTSWTQKQWIDGSIDYQWRTDFPPACLSGPYSFRTNTSLIGPAFSGTFETGDLLINGTLRANFYSAANVPAGLPVPQQGMLATLRAPAAGSFSYDVPNVYALNFSSGCF